MVAKEPKTSFKISRDMGQLKLQLKLTKRYSFPVGMAGQLFIGKCSPECERRGWPNLSFSAKCCKLKKFLVLVELCPPDYKFSHVPPTHAVCIVPLVGCTLAIY